MPPRVYVGGQGGVGPCSLREVGMGAGPQLPVVQGPGALGGISLATPNPQGRGRRPGESQAWGRNPRVRKGGRSLVPKVQGSLTPTLRPQASDKQVEGRRPFPNVNQSPSQGHPFLCHPRADLTVAYLGAGARWGHGERGGLILGVLQKEIGVREGTSEGKLFLTASSPPIPSLPPSLLLTVLT